jgi:ribosome-associated protein
MDGESIRVTRSVVLPLSDVQFRYSRSSGPGGQHAQKTETRVEAVLDVEASSAFSEAQKRRLVERLGPTVRAVAQDERSRARNRELALERLAGQLREGLRIRRSRRPTAPTEASRRRRLEEKRRRAGVKRLRKEPGPDP